MSRLHPHYAYSGGCMEVASRPVVYCDTANFFIGETPLNNCGRVGVAF